MNNSSLHKQLVKLYLLYFDSSNKFENRLEKASCYRAMRYLRQIELVAKQRRLEMKERFRQTDQYKNYTAPLNKKRLQIFMTKIANKENKKD